MRKLLSLGLALSTFTLVASAQTATPAQTPAAAKAAPAAQSAGSFSGKWEGTFARQLPDGTKSSPVQVVFDLTQAGKVLSGTAGPPTGGWKVENASVVAGKATFQVQEPGGPLFKFALTIVKDRLQGDFAAERDGKVLGTGKVDAGRAKPAK